jgi:hypothetical protein
MTTVQPTYEPAITYDFRTSVEENRLKGIWKMMVDYRLPYIGATAALAVSALAKTFTYFWAKRRKGYLESNLAHSKVNPIAVIMPSARISTRIPSKARIRGMRPGKPRKCSSICQVVATVRAATRPASIPRRLQVFIGK